MNPSIEVYVSTHKPIDFAVPDYCKKIQVNAEANGQWPGYLHDNDNPDNISLKNPNYCEMTALYSMWKNCKADIQGLYHYRRFLTEDEPFVCLLPADVVKPALSRARIASVLEEYDIILTEPVTISMLEKHTGLTTGESFSLYCYWKDMRELWRVIEEKYPDYLPSLEYVTSSDHYSPYNIFIVRRELADSYFTWLFDVLGEIERRISVESYDTRHKRACAYMSEILLNTYVHRHNLRIKHFNRFWIFPGSRWRMLLKKIPFLTKAVRAFRKRFVEKHNHTEETAEIETEKFSIAVIRYIRMDFRYYVAEFTPKNPDNFLHDLESAMPEFESQAKSEGMGFVPRVILSSETPESVRKSLFELGVRIIER